MYATPPTVWLSILLTFHISVRPSAPLQVVDTLCMQPFLQSYSNSSETLQVLRAWSENVHIVWI